MQLVVQRDGKVRCLYDEKLDLHSLGRLKISRGSHVEPTSDGRWTADLSPVRGQLLGPFDRRSEAIDAERRWLETHWLALEIANTR